MQKIGQEIQNSKGQRWLGKKLIENVPDHCNLVIDGLRFPEDHALMVEEFGPSLVLCAGMYIDLEILHKEIEIAKLPSNRLFMNPPKRKWLK